MGVCTQSDVIKESFAQFILYLFFKLITYLLCRYITHVFLYHVEDEFATILLLKIEQVCKSDIIKKHFTLVWIQFQLLRLKSGQIKSR